MLIIMNRTLLQVIFSILAVVLISYNLVIGQATPQTYTITANSSSFSPSTKTITTIDTIIFVYGSGSAHTATADDGSFAGNLTGSGSSFKVYDLPVGSYPFYCFNHGAPGGVGMSGTIFVTSGTTGINNSSATYDLSASPNPFNDQLSLNVNVGNKNLRFMKIYDLIGKEVAYVDLAGKTGTHSYNVDTSNLRAGIYFCTVYSDRGVVETMKLFKTNQ
jgi:plastocyanin